MGSSASKDDNTDPNSKDVLDDCPVLVDLSHGTIRHRMPDEKATKDSTIKTGYFYHARLDDFSEDAVISSDESYKLKYVFKGPTKANGKRLFYVYGNNLGAEDSGIQRGTYKPKGKGFNWPESYRKANNLYYDIMFLPSTQEEEELDDDDTLSVSTVITNDNEIQGTTKDTLSLKVKSNDSIENIKRRVSIRLLIPSVNIHLMHNKKELENEDVIREFAEEEEKSNERFHINLKLL